MDNKNDNIQYFEMVKNKCKQCRRCSCPYSKIDIGDYTFGELAKSLLELENDIPQNVMDSIFGCHECGYCLKECPKGFDVKEFIINAREYLIYKKPHLKAMYNNVRVDRKQHIFSKLKQTMDIVYDEALDSTSKCERLFFPSCHMAAKFSDLTNKTYQFLKDNNLVDGMSSICCGNPLYAAGLKDEFESYIQKLSNQLYTCGVKEIVTPCPNCFDFFKRMEAKGYLKSIVLIPLPKLLVEQGIYARKRNDINIITIHDACWDRRDGLFSTNIRKLFKNYEIISSSHSGKSTLCCGGGGLVPMYSLEMVKEAKEIKRNDYDKLQIDGVITTCFNCLDTLYNELPIYHFLEFIIENVDYDKYIEAKRKM